MRWSNPIHERILILFRDNLSPFWLNILSLHTDKNFVVLLIRRRLVFLGLFPSLFFFSLRRSAQRKLAGYTWLLKFYSKLFPERGLAPHRGGWLILPISASPRGGEGNEPAFSWHPGAAPALADSSRPYPARSRLSSFGYTCWCIALRKIAYVFAYKNPCYCESSFFPLIVVTNSISFWNSLAKPFFAWIPLNGRSWQLTGYYLSCE